MMFNDKLLILDISLNGIQEHLIPFKDIFIAS